MLAASPSMELPGDEITPVGLQRMWNLTRARLAGTSTLTSTSLVDEVEALQSTAPAQEPVETPNKCFHPDADADSDAEECEVDLYAQLPSLLSYLVDTVEEYFRGKEQIERAACNAARAEKEKSPTVVLDAGELGDIPAQYRVPRPEPHQMPVVGVYVDPRVRTGFRYKVRPMKPLDSSPLSVKPRYLFGGKALTLQSIGRGYARRFTFESVDSTLNNNENYFWSDSRQEGFVFEIEVISIGDKFTVYDANHEPQGTLEVVQIQKNQLEQDQKLLGDGSIEKRVKISTLCQVEWYNKNGGTNLVPVTGVAITKISKGCLAAAVLKIKNVAIGIKQNRKGYELMPGVQSSLRRTTVSGSDIHDVPTVYTVVGLERYELPVVGTYVDPRVIPGFHYRIRPAGSRRHLFEGRSMLLQSVGIGYGKRITFKPDTLNAPENYFWSDTHPDGVGMEPRAIHTGMKFEITANGTHLGEASVFRADLPQAEEKTELVEVQRGGRSGVAVEKRIHVEATCHVKLATTGGGSVDSEVHLMKVSGVAVVRKTPGQSAAELLRVDRVGLDSQLNLLFVQSQTELTFHPIP